MQNRRENTASSGTTKQDEYGSFTAAHHCASIPTLASPYRLTSAGMINGLVEVAAEVDGMREQMASKEDEALRSGGIRRRLLQCWNKLS